MDSAETGPLLAILKDVTTMRAESGERRAVIWRAVSNEKPIIVKNISYFRNYF